MKSKLIMFLLITGMIVAGYSTYNHYYGNEESICNLSELLNCNVVNKSVYSKIFGIPVATLGFLTYVLLWFLYEKKMWREAMLIISGAAIFTVYLTYVEIFILKTICPLCVANAVVVFYLLFLTWKKSGLTLKNIKDWLVKPL